MTFCARGQQINQVALKLVRVLILVHEHELEAPLIQFAHVGVFLQQLEPEHEQIVEIHRVGGELAGDVTFPTSSICGASVSK
jgi:hypothetical protein